MFRNVLFSMLCLAIAFLGVSGLHVHRTDAEPGHQHEAQLGGHAHAVTVIDSDHGAEHEHQGDIDIEPMAKAFGKLSLSQLAPLFALLYVLIGTLAGMAGALVLRTPPHRPPVRSVLPYFLPPSQAPPATASLR